jgi:hypothetical protein
VRHLIANTFNNSLFSLLAAAHPTHEWQPWHFLKHPGNIWNDKTIRAFFLYAEKKLGIKKPEDWYTVRASHIAELGGSLCGLLKQGKPLRNM